MTTRPRQHRPAARSTGPRLRFDKVVIRVTERLQKALRAEVPDDVTVLVAMTAPIRLASQTAAALEQAIRALLASGRRENTATMFGNRVRIRIERPAAAPTRVMLFVHNPGADARALFALAPEWPRQFREASRRHTHRRTAASPRRNGRTPRTSP